jgi:3-hydroxyacyl-CoA dehydrogenase
MGFNVIVYDLSDSGIERCRKAHQQFVQLFMRTRGASRQEIEQTHSRSSYTTNLADAVKDADIISESIPEDIEIKKSFYTVLAKVAPERTIFTTNSSATLRGEYAKETGHPGKFVALHFANGIWDANVGEVMGHAGTDEETFDRVVEFAREIGMVPIPIHKKQNGYVLNSLLIPLLSAAEDLLFDGVGDVESIDKAWMISAGVKMGPFGIMDMIGMETMYNIDKLWGEKLGDKKIAGTCRDDQRKLHRQGGEGCQYRGRVL